MIAHPRKLRSRLHFELMALLVGHVAVPIAVAELYVALRSVKHPSLWLNKGRSWLYVYLRRLAEQGMVRVTRVEDRLAVLLTVEGERELRRYERRGGAAGHSLVPNVAESRRPAAGVIRRVFARAGGTVRETEAFVSYDVPVGSDSLRIMLGRTLEAARFRRLHESMWVGDPRRLPAVVAWAERQEILPHLHWGAIQIFPGTRVQAPPHATYG